MMAGTAAFVSLSSLDELPDHCVWCRRPVTGLWDR
uniref:Uncharacterized protein n=2 Tax=environmental samples TaxID=129696 RepID=E7C555_9HYPH|nr:hypothetical protein [uncultured Rhizobium sp. HF0130_09F11]ADI22579.1 hypothetical protein [uncultured Rhizobium sp. HF0500_10F10]